MRYATLYIASIIIVLFVAQQIEPSLTDNFKLVSADLAERPWTLFTSVFLHSTATHLLYNLFGLLLFGLILEQKIGTRRFLAVFAASGILASIAASLFYQSALGASGAIFGIIGALAILRPLMVVWVSYIPMPIFAAAIFWAAGDMLGFLIPSNIANAAHLAGLALGIIFGFLIRGKKPLFTKRKKQPPAVTKQELDAWEEKHMFKD